MFTHLHVHSRHSFLDGLCSSENLVEEAVRKEFTSLALTDHGSIAGWVQFYKAAKKHGIKPLLGVEAYFVDSVNERSKDRYHVVLLAKNDQGITKLFDLLTQAHDHFYYKPRIDTRMLMQVTGDVIVLSACVHGLLSNPNNVRLAKLLHERFQGDFFLEVMPFDMPEQRYVNGLALELNQEFGIPLVSTNDVHYASADHAEIHSFLLELNTGGKMGDLIEGLYLRSEVEMREAFKLNSPELAPVIDEAFANTQVIVDRCNVSLEKRDVILPKLVEDSQGHIRERSQMRLQQFSKRIPADVYPEYEKRLDYELDVIEQKKFADYFVVVKDVCSHAREMGYEQAVGRGSAGGSLLSYLLRITDLDPMRYNLQFERFLNPERTDWPDIDLDFPDDKRAEIIEYLKDKHGRDRVANISTYTALKPKSAFKDVAKHFGIPHGKAEEISKLLDNSQSLNESMKEDGQVDALVKKLPNWQKIVQYTDAIVGCYRQPGKHAAGVVIAPVPLKTIGVLEVRGDDRVVSWDMDDAAYMGLVKIDLLGLRTLAIIGKAKELIKARSGNTIHWDEVELDDPEVMDAFNKGYTIGCMQFESAIQKKQLKDLAPVTTQTIIDSNALGRPGPLDSGMTQSYILRKKSQLDTGIQLAYEPFVQEATKDTFGVIVYQEQITEILKTVAGYNTAQADIIRRVIAKSKGHQEMERHREEFLIGCSHKNMPREIANLLFDDLIKYSRYSFNRSHATAYSLTAIRQMWLKIHYPAEYMTALFSQTSLSKEAEGKISQFRSECERLGIQILPPHINHSQSGFSLWDGSILTGLQAIKGVGPKAVEAILEARTIPFRSFEDFVIRVDKRAVNKGIVINLVKVGAFDCFRLNVRETIFSIDRSSGSNYLPKSQQNMFDNGGVLGQNLSHGDYNQDEKSRLRAELIPGVFTINANVGLNIHSDKMDKFVSIIRKCQACSMYGYYECPVPPDYTLGSKLMVVGEAPGKDEIAVGKSLVGKAGRLLGKALMTCGLSRAQCYVTTVYKCRPLDNKLTPQTPSTCWKYLIKEIEMLQPKLILALGNTPLKFFLGQSGGIMAKNATVDSVKVGDYTTNVLWCVHPASCLRSNDNFELFKEAFIKLHNTIN